MTDTESEKVGVAINEEKKTLTRLSQRPKDTAHKNGKSTDRNEQKVTVKGQKFTRPPEPGIKQQQSSAYHRSKTQSPNRAVGGDRTTRDTKSAESGVRKSKRKVQPEPPVKVIPVPKRVSTGQATPAVPKNIMEGNAIQRSSQQQVTQDLKNRMTKKSSKNSEGVANSALTNRTSVKNKPKSPSPASHPSARSGSKTTQSKAKPKSKQKIELKS